MTATAGATETDLGWHGPASVVAVVAGTLVGIIGSVATAHLALGLPPVLPWALGLPLLLVRGRVRHVGTGLVASGLVQVATWVSFTALLASFT